MYRCRLIREEADKAVKRKKNKHDGKSLQAKKDLQALFVAYSKQICKNCVL